MYEKRFQRCIKLLVSKLMCTMPLTSIVQSESTRHRLMCEVILDRVANGSDICQNSCVQGTTRNPPSHWTRDNQIFVINDNVIEKYTNGPMLKQLIAEILNFTKPCETIAYCANYMHICKTCGTPSIWHPSDFINEHGQIQLHPSHGNTSNASHRPKRAINGFEPNEYSMPWNVYIVIRGWKNHAPTVNICGGTLIDENTATGDCDDYYGDNVIFSISYEPDIVVNNDDIGLQYREIIPSNLTVINIPNAISGNRIENDIAILKLPYPVKISHTVSPACLPDGYDMDKFTLGNPTHRFLAGAWGDSTYKNLGEQTGYFRQITLQEQPSDDYRYIRAEHELNDEDGSLYRDVCGGDSGSGLMTLNTNNQWIVAGVVSSGPSCIPENKAAGEPGHYANVPLYLPWIRKQMIDVE